MKTHHTKLPIGVSLLLAVLLVLLLSGCTKQVQKQEKPTIAVSILPHKWFLEQIALDTVDPLVLVGPGQSPHSYEPTPQQIAQLSSAKAWILSGTDFEVALLPKIKEQQPSLTIINGIEGVTLRSLEKHGHDDEEGDHSDEEGGDHSDEEGGDHADGVDRHTWLGREPSKILCGHILETLITAMPENKDMYTKNYEVLIAKIDAEFNALTPILAPLRGKKVFVFHPAFGYFFEEYGIIQEAVETGGKEPSAKDIAAIIEKAQQEKPAAIFVQAQFPATAVTTIAKAFGSSVVPLDPLAENWLENIKSMGKTLAQEAMK